MKHYGDITKINGAEAPVVDIITGGSPCQDLSVAGKRAGLAGERSGLFMEQMRIVKEMRERERATGRTGWMVRPRYMGWENVPGVFSSGNPKGADFAAVIEEIIKVAEPGAAVSVCVPNGGWTKSGCYYAEDGSWSVAWRVHDAQFWGVPQRRKRISLVADFGGLSAPEILFERKGLSGDSEPCGAQREEAAGAVGGGTYPTVARRLTQRYDGSPCVDRGPNIVMQNAEPIPINTMIATRCKALGRGTGFGVSNPGDPAFTIPAAHEHAVFCLQGNGIDRADTAGCNGRGWCEDVSYTLNTIDRPAVAFAQNQRNEVRDLGDIAGALAAEPGMKQQTFVYDARGNGDGKTVCTITGDHQNSVTDYTALCVGNGQANQSVSDKAGALNTMHDQQAVMVSAVDCRNLNEHQEVSGTLQCKQNGGYSLNYQNPIMVQGAYKNAETRSKTLLLLQETYGEETILKWGTAILERLQQADILQQGVYESRISGEAEKWNELDDCALPRTELVTGWMLRDLWKQQKCGRSPQGWESAEQQSGQFAESLPKLSQQNSQACKDLFDMWQKGEGLWLLREALSEIQKIWKSLNGQRQSVYGHSIVRRLTPLEAERLQGYPDGWTDIGEWVDSNGKKHGEADSPRYKALGNSIALPFWQWMARRICAQYERPVTMASLFDGIGGFPLVFQRCGAVPVWASEIEEFPIAVTKVRFPDEPV